MTNDPDEESTQDPEQHDGEESDIAASDSPGRDMNLKEMLDVERRIHAGEDVSDEERATYERVSADLRKTLRSIRIPTQTFQLPADTQAALSDFLRSQQHVTEGFRKQLQDAFTTTIKVPSLSMPSIAFPKITAPTYPITVTPVGLQLQPSHSKRPDESPEEEAGEADADADELELRPEAIDSAPVEQATALLTMADRLDAQQAVFQRGNEIAELQVEETRRLNEIMQLVKTQSDRQGKFTKGMGWFMAAIGVGTVVIPTWQLVIMLNGG